MALPLDVKAPLLRCFHEKSYDRWGGPGGAAKAQGAAARGCRPRAGLGLGSRAGGVRAAL